MGLKSLYLKKGFDQEWCLGLPEKYVGCSVERFACRCAHSDLQFETNLLTTFDPSPKTIFRTCLEQVSNLDDNPLHGPEVEEHRHHEAVKKNHLVKVKSESERS